MAGAITTAAAAESQLLSLGNASDIPTLRRFFRTGPGEYGEGDEFLGIRVPVLRKLSRELRQMPLAELLILLQSRFREARLLALFVMVDQFKRGDAAARADLYRAYLAHTRWINNWDLVDSSAEHIVGAYLHDRDRAPLRALAASASLWERRIAMLATFHFIRRNDFNDTLDLAERLLGDTHDLIHTAAGWMLREVGNRDRARLDEFLGRHYRNMPRTMLRYAIEKHDPARRQQYLRGEV